jgi:hypothetical protein
MLHTFILAAGVALYMVSRNVDKMTAAAKWKAFAVALGAVIVLMFTSSASPVWLAALAVSGLAAWKLSGDIMEKAMVARHHRRAPGACSCGATKADEAQDHDAAASQDKTAPETPATKAATATRKAARKAVHSAWKAATK